MEAQPLCGCLSRVNRFNFLYPWGVKPSGWTSCPLSVCQMQDQGRGRGRGHDTLLLQRSDQNLGLYYRKILYPNIRSDKCKKKLIQLDIYYVLLFIIYGIQGSGILKQSCPLARLGVTHNWVSCYRKIFCPEIV